MAQKKRKSFWQRVRFKYKLSFLNEATLEEVWSFRMSKLTAFTIVVAFSLLLIAITSLIIIKTPIRNYLPGYLDVEIRNKAMQNILRVDSLERVIEVQTLYLNNITGILTGTIALDSIQQIDSTARVNPDYNIPQGAAEAQFREAFVEEEKYNLTTLNPYSLVGEGTFFVKPINGVISSAFEADIRHYGVDLVAKPNESVLSTLDGTVIYAGYDPNFGNVIQVQHKNGFTSIYKHNDLLLKNIGDKVSAGEAIAIIGNTGKLTTGPHLHFELWHQGNPVNPADYIAF